MTKQDKSQIPEFKNRQEMAKWFNTHDMGDYQDQFKTVKVKFAKNLSHGITVNLDPKSLKQLREEANKKGVGPTTLAKEWIIEHLQP